MRLLPIAVLALCSACATPQSTPIAPAPADKALVVVYRPSQVGGTDIDAPFAVDGTRLFELGPGQRAELLLSPGRHVLETRKAGGMRISAPGKTVITVQAGRTYFIEWSAMTGSAGRDYDVSSGVFRPVPEEEGAGEAGQAERIFRSQQSSAPSSRGR